jgi:Domain of unknown function (DUF4365)
VTEEQKKEMISREFVRILAHAHGFKIMEPAPDHGVDMVVCPVAERTEPSGKVRYLDSQYKLDFQLKATTVHSVGDEEDNIRFDLEAKNFNDLVARRDDILPLHLVLVVLSEAPPTCVDVDERRIAVMGRAFWYLPDTDEIPTENVATVRIRIPKANLLGHDFIRGCYDRLGIAL